MIPPRPRPLCAICADREATTATDWESRGIVREVPACRPCLSPVPDPPEMSDDLTDLVATRPAMAKRGCRDTTLRDAIMTTVRQRGTVTSKELQAEFTMVSDADRCALAKSLSRMVDRGQLVAAWVDESDHRQGRSFAIPSGPPPTLVAGLAFLSTLPEAFSGDDAAKASGLAGHKLGPVMRALAAAGLIVKTAARYVSGDRVVPSAWRKVGAA